jgi:hypothetical protein
MESWEGSIEVRYVDFSDDGRNFYRGFEKSRYSVSAENTYEADLTVSGVEPGEMKFRAAFSKASYSDPPKLLFEKAEDGKPKSYGYAAYRGITLNIEDMSE